MKNKRFLGIIARWVLTAAVVWCCGVSSVMAAPYYSIHIASFSLLKNANSFVNSLSTAEKVVFWREVDVPNKGLYYRVFIGRYPSYQSALDAWNSLNKEERVHYQGIFQFDSEEISKMAQSGIQGSLEADDSTLPPPPSSVDILPENRFVDNGDGTVTDTKHQLMWVKNGWPLAFFAATQWDDAVAKCRQFSHGGYQDWTLPSVNQWKTILDPRQEAPALPNPNPFENVVIHLPYWSSTEMVKFPVKVYAVQLYSGRIHQLRKDERAFIFPVRILSKEP